jgi:tRNA(Ile)-lysidine synthase
LIETIRTYINKHHLLPENNQPVVVGLSGGADSVALLAVLVRLGYSCIAAHCNFRLRGEESERDEAFAKKIAADMNVPFYQTVFDTLAYAKEKHLSVEMAARELRYGWFEEMRRKLEAQAIAVAHHRDDSVETILMNLIRGSGIHGLSGIRPRNGFVVRPLLPVSRKEISDWLKQQHYTCIMDSSNLSEEYTRNFLRLRVLPLLEEINPSVRQAIARSGEHLSGAARLYDYVVEEAIQKVKEEENRFSIPALMNYPAPETILYELLKPYGFSRIVSRDVFLSLTKTPGKTFFSARWRLIKDRGSLLLSPLPDTNTADSYMITSEKDTGHLPVKLSFCKIIVSDKEQMEKDRHTAWFDYDKLRFPLALRHWRKGDWFIPFGMEGRKKLSDYFSDRKFSRIQKEETWLLCHGEDILWVVGERADNRFRMDGKTKQALIVKKVG